MILTVGLENYPDGRALAWALDYPGCFSAGADGSTAIVSLPRAFLKYREWVARHTPDSWLANVGDFDVRLVETWQVYSIDARTLEVINPPGVEINAWFRRDWKPLTMQEVRRGLQMLTWSRADLLAALADLTPEQLDASHPGERWSIRGILEHVARAEGWYLDRLGLAGDLLHPAVPVDPLERLAHTRAQLERSLPDLAGSPVVLGVEGEFWSPRKLLRRALWHELDHVGHILKLKLAALSFK